jgi:hypothetical protein
MGRPAGATGRRAAIAYASRYDGGVVGEVAPAEATVLVRPGQRLMTPDDPAFAPHVAYAIATHPSSSAAAYRAAREKVDACRIAIA